MSKLICLILVFLLQSSLLYSEEKKIIVKDSNKDVERLIDEEIKMMLSIKFPKAQHHHRLFELYIEKIEIIRQKENKKFLEDSTKIPDLNSKKASYFQLSKKFYEKAHHLALRSILGFENYRYNADILYSLATLSRDYDNNKYTEAYLLKALRLQLSKSLEHKIYIALAEYYYNEKRFREATSFYERIKRNEKDPWKTKHLFNNAWCLFQGKEYNHALSEMLLSFDYSNRKDFVNINDQILKNITIFFITAKRVDDGIQFFLKKSPEPDFYLRKLAERTVKDGDYPQTKNIVEHIREYLSKDRDPLKFLALYEFELDIYDQFKKYPLFFKTALKIKEEYVDKKQSAAQPIQIPSTIIDRIEARTNFLQTELAKILVQEARDSERTINAAKEISSFYIILKALNPPKNCEYHFLHGENYFVIYDYPRALNQYSQAIGHCTSTNNLSILDKTISALLGTLPKAKSISKSQSESLYELGYINYLKYWPLGKFAENFSTELFKIYINQKKLPEATSAFLSHFQNFRKKSESAIMKMLDAVLDLHVAKKDASGITTWLDFIRANQITYTKEHIENITSILAGILFDELQKTESKDIASSIKGYLKIFEDKVYPAKIKSQAALLVAYAYLKLGKNSDFTKWIENFLHIAPPKEFKQNKSSIFLAFNDLYIQGDFKNLLPLISTLTKGRCLEVENDEKQKILDYYFDGLLLTNKLTDQTYSQFSTSCSFDKNQINQHLDQTYAYYMDSRDFNKAIDILKKIAPKNLSKYTDPLLADFWSYYSIDEVQKYKALMTYLDQLSKTFNQPKLIDDFDDIATFENLQAEVKLQHQKGNLKPQTQFNESLFNDQLSITLELLANFTADFDKRLKNRHPSIVVKLLIQMSNLYNEKAQMIDHFEVKGMPEEYVSGFKQEMKNLTRGLFEKGKAYSKAAREVAIKSETLHYFEREELSIDTRVIQYHRDISRLSQGITSDLLRVTP